MTGLVPHAFQYGTMEGYENVPESLISTAVTPKEGEGQPPRSRLRRPAKYYHPTDENGSSIFLASSSDVYEAAEVVGAKNRSVFGYDVAPPMGATEDENETCSFPRV